MKGRYIPMTLTSKLALTVASLALMTAGPALATELPQGQEGGMTATEAAVTPDMQQGAFNFVQSTAEKGLKFLSNPESTMDVKKQEFRKLLDNSFDLDTIGRFALGRYWNTATPAQQKDYLTQFRRMVVDVYAARFGDYKGQQFQAKSFSPINQTDTKVTSFIVPANGGENIQVDWRVRYKNGGYKIVDVIVSGVSMSATQRADFASVIQRGGGNVDALISQLKTGKTAPR